ncbi:MAG TPA: chemotaxis protein CheB [Kofleriaceae bacterium]|nr:chemotaxis protein CheB [Kofleriaceae bacterium]
MVEGNDGAPAVTAFPVVGIGASAGGLDALEQLFAALPADTGMAFVVVTHSHPGRPSLMPEILARKTAMPVVAVEAATQLVPDRVYLAPSGQQLVVHDQLLIPRAVGDHQPRALAIDALFRSLAAERRQAAIAVVLSGSGSDGTLGIREIKAAGGLAIAQDEASARFPSMPHNAVATELVDHVLAPADIPAALIDHARQIRTGRPAPAPTEDAELARIFSLVERVAGHDFSAYKRSTLRRRIERRMNVHHLATLGDYATFIEEHPGEVGALFQELLIGITSFFRDPEAFDAVARALPPMLAGRPADLPLRVWCAGCSTGEEAYSIAILARECLDSLRLGAPVQIFATDLDPKAIEVARRGFYPDSIAADVSGERLARFFTHEDGAYQIRKDLREMVVFAPHNVASDPPFTRLDLLACRNLLIYLDAGLQARLMPLFHYALRPGGLLFLGSSESTGVATDLFDVVDKKWKLFRRRPQAAASFTPRFVSPSAPDPHRAIRVAAAARIADPGVSTAAERLLLQHLVPATVVVHASGEIVHIHGRTGPYLELPPGPVTSLNVVAMARPGLGGELATALREAALTDQEVVRRGIRLDVEGGGEPERLDLRVQRMVEPAAFRDMLLVSFVPQRGPAPPADDGPPEAGERIAMLEQEVLHTRSNHQAIVEEREAANEELKSTNEELQSTNEELQSTNEELETSKEEMQSLNEELQTVNAELQGKLDELSRANDDLRNLMNATDIATVFLDHGLRIKRYTEQAKKVIPLIPADVGRPIGDLVSRLKYAELIPDAVEVLGTLVFKETEVCNEDGRWYLIRILPYRTTGNVIDGLVITFVDVSRVHGLQERASAILEALAASPTSVFGQDRELRYTWACSRVHGVAPAELVGKTDRDLIGDHAAALEAIKRRTLETGEPRRERVTLADPSIRYDVFVQVHRSRNGTIDGLSGVMTQLTS